MASVTIRALDPEVKERLRQRAAAHSRSMEAEARAILSDAVRPKRMLRELYDRARPYAVPDGLPIPERTDQARAAEL